MDGLSPHHVPVYETREQQRTLWQECAERGQPVVAIRDARRGYIVRYDLQHLGVELAPDTLETLRRWTRNWRTYPTTDGSAPGTGQWSDPVSESEGVGGEAGPVSGDLHAPSERRARELASRLATLVFPSENWT